MKIQKVTNKIPSKTSVNLAMHEDQSGNIRLIAISSLLILLMSFAVAKFGVLDQLDRLHTAEKSYQTTHQQLTDMKAALEAYDEVERDYRTHSTDWVGTEQESTYASVDRQVILDLAETQLMTRGSISGISVFKDVMNVSMSGMTLEEISEMIFKLREQPIVRDVQLNLAQTDKDVFSTIRELEEETIDAVRSSGELSFSLTITLQPQEVEG